MTFYVEGFYTRVQSRQQEKLFHFAFICSRVVRKKERKKERQNKYIYLINSGECWKNRKNSTLYSTQYEFYIHESQLCRKKSAFNNTSRLNWAFWMLVEMYRSMERANTILKPLWDLAKSLFWKANWHLSWFQINISLQWLTGTPQAKFLISNKLSPIYSQLWFKCTLKHC